MGPTNGGGNDMGDFGKLSYNLLLNHFSKPDSERQKYDFSQDIAKLIELFNNIAGEPLDDIDLGQETLHSLTQTINPILQIAGKQSSQNEHLNQFGHVKQYDKFEVVNEASDDDHCVESQSSEEDEYINLSVPPVAVDSNFRKLFPHVAACFDQVSSGEIHLDGQYGDIKSMWNEASIACLVSPAEMERAKSLLQQSLVKYLIDTQRNSSNDTSNASFDAKLRGRKVAYLLNLMSWYFAGYYTAKLEQ